LFFAAAVAVGIGLMFFPFYLVAIGESLSFLLLELITIPLGITLIYAIYNTYQSLTPYIRHSGEGGDVHLPDGADLLALFDISLKPFRMTKNTVFKFLLSVKMWVRSAT
jgi:hypothetical protein